MFSRPAALSRGWIIRRCNRIDPTPSDAIVRFTASMPTLPISTLVAVLSDSTIISTARSCSDSMDCPSPKYCDTPVPPTWSAARTGTRSSSDSVPLSA